MLQMTICSSKQGRKPKRDQHRLQSPSSEGQRPPGASTWSLTTKGLCCQQIRKQEGITCNPVEIQLRN